MVHLQKSKFKLEFVICSTLSITGQKTHTPRPELREAWHVFTVHSDFVDNVGTHSRAAVHTLVQWSFIVAVKNKS